MYGPTHRTTDFSCREKCANFRFSFGMVLRQKSATCFRSRVMGQGNHVKTGQATLKGKNNRRKLNTFNLNFTLFYNSINFYVALFSTCIVSDLLYAEMDYVYFHTSSSTCPIQKITTHGCASGDTRGHCWFLSRKMVISHMTQGQAMVVGTSIRFRRFQKQQSCGMVVRDTGF